MAEFEPERGGDLTAVQLIADVIGKVWALPNTLLGLAAVAVLAPFAYANGGRFQVGNNAIQLLRIPFGGGALTLGNIQLYFGTKRPSDNITYGERGINTGLHEQYHTYQSQVLGPLFLPCYLLAGPVACLHNPFEAAAQDFARSNWASRIAKEASANLRQPSNLPAPLVFPYDGVATPRS
jgi:hypothetical protein